MFKDLTGAKFGRLTVIRREGSRIVGTKGKYRATWFCLCECGGSKVATSLSLNIGHTSSCGCLRKEIPNRLSHGKRAKGVRSRAYQTWASMKARCYNSRERTYKDYGGKGIKVCDRWLESFENFLEDMGEPSDRSLQLDRCNNDLGYCKKNCRWTTSVVNGRNRSITVKIEGVPLGEIAEKHGLDYHKLYHQLVVRNQGLQQTIAKLTAL